MNRERCDQSEWPRSLPEIKEFDALLRCGICYETMKTAMMLQQCSHNYCSLCIRKYMTFKTQCPTCRVSASDLDLRNNRVVDNLIKQFQSVRTKLLELACQVQRDGAPTSNTLKKGTNTEQLKTDMGKTAIDSQEQRRPTKRLIQSSESEASDDEFDLTYTPKSTRKSSTRNSKAQPAPSVMQESPQTSTNLNNSCNVPKIQSPSSTKWTLKSPEFKGIECTTPKQQASTSTGSTGSSASTSGLQSPSIQNAGDTPSTQINRVDCPVCGVSVPSKHINLHLDRCLKSEHFEPRQSPAPQKRRRLAKLVYNLLSDKELRKKLTDYKLSTQGDRQTLVKRHHEFTLLYNADCDSLHPKSVEDLVKEVQQNEKTKAQLTFSPAVSRSNSLQINKGATNIEVENAQKHYAKQHKSQFSQLIADTKARMKKAQQANKQSQQQEGHPVQETDSADRKTPDKKSSTTVVNHEANKGPALPILESHEGTEEPKVMQNTICSSEGESRPSSSNSVRRGQGDLNDTDAYPGDRYNAPIPQIKITGENLKQNDATSTFKTICEKTTKSSCTLSSNKSVSGDVASGKTRETSSCVQTKESMGSRVSSSLGPSQGPSDESNQDLLGSDEDAFQNSGSLISHDSSSSHQFGQRARSGSDATSSEGLGWLSQRCHKGNSESNTRDGFDRDTGSPNLDLLGIESISFKGILNGNSGSSSSRSKADCQEDHFNNDVDEVTSRGSESDAEDLMASPVFNASAHNVQSNGLTAEHKEQTLDEGAIESSRQNDFNTGEAIKDIPVFKLMPGEINDDEDTKEYKFSPVKSPQEVVIRKRKLRSRSPKEQMIDIPTKKSRKDLRNSKGEENMTDNSEGVCTRRQLRPRKK